MRYRTVNAVFLALALFGVAVNAVGAVLYVISFLEVISG